MKDQHDSDSKQVGRGSTVAVRPLRAPKQHGESLQDPPLIDVDRVWKSSLEPATADVAIGDIPWESLKQLARSELVELATRYSRSYLDVEPESRSFDRVVMAGHQPELFHPGVWYKNFVLSEIGTRFNAVAINLVVDNDICGNTSIRYPRIDNGHVGTGTIPLDRPGYNLPFEARSIEDFDFFRSFESRVLDAMGGQVDSPIVKRLWPNVIEAANRLMGEMHPRLGHSIAAGRHRLERQIGLKTLEVPVSWMAGTESFAFFVESILLDLERFQDVYNGALLEYRVANRIRSRAHPVPPLEQIEGWRESPFWVWVTDHPRRARLYSRVVRGRIELSDRAGWQTEIEIAHFRSQFRELDDQGVAVRPKALMTTMFSRLVVSDLFLHGIGGAKYDQLTDVIAERFYSCRLPSYLTLSATMKLPSDREIVGREDLVRLNQTLRDLEFHPERSISGPSVEAIRLIQQKHQWTQGDRRNERSRSKHLAIGELNRRLREYVASQAADLRLSRDQVLGRLRSSEILDSREYSFCLFPEGLIEELKRMAWYE